MAYGNASKKTVPLSALSTEDLDYIAKHIDTGYGEKISELEKTVKNNNSFVVRFTITGTQILCDKTNKEIVEAIHGGRKIFATYSIAHGSEKVDVQEMVSYRTAKGYVDVGSGMAAVMEWVIFEFFDGSDYLTVEYDPQYSAWKVSVEVIPDKNYVDDAIRSAIYDSWEDAV